MAEKGKIKNSFLAKVIKHEVAHLFADKKYGSKPTVEKSFKYAGERSPVLKEMYKTYKERRWETNEGKKGNLEIVKIFNKFPQFTERSFASLKMT